MGVLLTFFVIVYPLSPISLTPRQVDHKLIWTDMNKILGRGCDWGKLTSDKGRENITDYRQNEKEITD